MKKKIFSFLFLLAFIGITYGQDKPVKFSVEVSTDSILMDNYFEVKFNLENADGQNFEAPDFAEAFNVVSGPNFSSSVNMINGSVTQNMTITYYLEPKDIGAYYIQPASVMAGDEVLETAPIEVMVHPNPDGIKQSPSMNHGGFHMQFGDPFGGSSPFDMDEFFKGFDQNAMPFRMEDFFKDFDNQTMPFNLEELFRGFEQDSMSQDLNDWFRQFDMEMPELQSPSPEDGKTKKKKRKTTRI